VRTLSKPHNPLTVSSCSALLRIMRPDALQWGTPRRDLDAFPDAVVGASDDGWRLRFE
jgi:hypothetical protein